MPLSISSFIIIITAHFFVTLFLHSFFLHRYATHRQFSMSLFWERFFFITTWLLQGFSALNPRTYALLHLEHHKHSDTIDDPHSPHNFSRSKYGTDVFRQLPRMMVHTQKIFQEITKGIHVVYQLYKNHKTPSWNQFESFAYSLTTRCILGVFVIIFYILFAPVWWCWLFLPITLLNGALQGAIVNWFGHMAGYRNFDTPDKSRNTWIFSTIMMGELFQNNHHQDHQNPNFGRKWFELDPTFVIMKVFHRVRIIKMK